MAKRKKRRKRKRKMAPPSETQRYLLFGGIALVALLIIFLLVRQATSTFVAILVIIIIGLLVALQVKKWIDHEWNKIRRFEAEPNLDRMRAMDPFAFEAYIAWVYQQYGYEAKVTPESLEETVGKVGEVYKVKDMKKVEAFSTEED